MTVEEINPTEKNKEVEKKKSNKTIIIINIVALLVIIAIVVYYFFFFNKKNDFGLARGFADQEFSAEDLCERWLERQDNTKERQLPDGVDVPSNFQDRMEEENSLMEKICEDEKVNDDERAELENLRGNFGGSRMQN